MTECREFMKDTRGGPDCEHHHGMCCYKPGHKKFTKKCSLMASQYQVGQEDDGEIESYVGR